MQRPTKKLKPSLSLKKPYATSLKSLSARKPSRKFLAVKPRKLSQHKTLRKLRPLPTSLDRLLRLQRRTLNRAAGRIKRKTNSTLSRKALHVAGLLGFVVVRRAGAVRRVVLLRKRGATSPLMHVSHAYCGPKHRARLLYATTHNYRLKLAAVEKYTERREPARLAVCAPLNPLQYRGYARTRYLAYARSRDGRKMLAFRQAFSGQRL